MYVYFRRFHIFIERHFAEKKYTTKVLKKEYRSNILFKFEYEIVYPSYFGRESI